MVSKTIALIIRAFQALLSIITMALIGHMISTSGWNQIPRKGGNAAEVNYAIFTSVFTLISMPLFVFTALKGRGALELTLATLILDALNLLFYMCGGIALAAAMEIHSCNNKIYTTSNRITNSSPDTRWRCREAQAATAFVWFSFLAFITSTTYSLIVLANYKKPPGEEPPPAPDDPPGGPPVADGAYHTSGRGVLRGGPPIAEIRNDNRGQEPEPGLTGGPPVAMY